MKYSLPPPQNWQDFQELTEAVAKRVSSDSMVQTCGRDGQEQHGIDIYVQMRRIGIQAKNRRLFNAAGKLEPNGVIAIEEIKQIVAAAQKFRPQLSKVIVATTALTDGKLQTEVIILNEERAAQSLFPPRTVVLGTLPS